MMAIAMAKDVVGPIFSGTGKFDSKPVAVPSRSFVVTNLLPSELDMSKLCGEEFLSGGS